MADRQNLRNQTRPMNGNQQPGSAATFLRRLHERAPSSSQLMGILTLFISGGILLLLTGATVTFTVLGLVLFTPLILISSPIWIPAGLALFSIAAVFLSLCGAAVAFVTGVTWIYRYFRGLHPIGSDSVDSARSRIYDTATHVKDYAREYGGYLPSKTKDAAPGA